MNTSKLILSHPSTGISPAGFTRIHVEMLPKEVGRLIGYDPRVLVMKPKRGKVARGSRDIMPHNVSQSIIDLQNQVQRSIDNPRVSTMMHYLADAMTKGTFADWGAIELVTSAKPDTSEMQKNHTVAVDADADYFIADGQHRYCALLDFIREYPQYADRFTQSVTISILPEEKLLQWAGQEFHDRNYFSVPVRAGKALSVDTRDPLNALTKEIATLKPIKDAGGVSYDRDALLKNDPNLITHSMLHRFVRGFLFGRPGLDKGGADTRAEIDPKARENLFEYITALSAVLPWTNPPEERDQYLTRTSAVISALAVVGNDLYTMDPAMTQDERVKKLVALSKIDWKRTNLGLVGVVGSEKDGQVQPTSSRQAIDSTIRFLREKLDIQKGN
jgi:DGQHR domain-containing protein